MIKKIGTGVGALLFLAVMAFALSGWVKGRVFGLVWQHFGDDEFICGGNQVVTITGKTLEMDGTIISAGGDCRITLKDCHLKGTETISLGGNAVLIIEGGTIEGTKVAVSANGAGLEIHDATIKGGTIGLEFHGRTAQFGRVEDSNIEGVTAVSASHGGELTFTDSTITGTKLAVEASIGTVVNLGNSTVTGKTKQNSKATIIP